MNLNPDGRIFHQGSILPFLWRMLLKKIKLNTSSLQEDFRKIAIAILVAVLVASIINEKPLLDNIVALIFAALIWFLGLIKNESNNSHES